MMVNLLSKDQLAGMSPEGRIRNSYESLYYRTPSGDPESDDVLRRQLQSSFKTHDVLLADKPDTQRLRQIMVHAVEASTSDLQGAPLTQEQTQKIAVEFDHVSTSRNRFYETTFDSFEKRHHGEPVDFSADFERMLQENGGKPVWETEMTEEALASMESDWLSQQPRDETDASYSDAVLSPMARSTPKRSDAFNRDQAPHTRSGLSYEAVVPEAVVSRKKPAYVHAAEERAAAREQKAKVDVPYEQYAQSKGNGAKFSAADQFGYDEPEDDGPEL